MDDDALMAYTGSYRTAVLSTLRRSSQHMCVALTEPLHAALGFLGVPASMVEADLPECQHVFLRLADGRVLDASADQFGPAYPPVYLGPPIVKLHHPTTVWHRDLGWAGLIGASQHLLSVSDARAVGDLVGLTLLTSGALPTASEPDPHQ